MKLYSIASGSSGNCTFVGSSTTNLLIDVGISAKRIETALLDMLINPDFIDGILITHEHSDHIKGLCVLQKKHPLKLYATTATIEAITKALGKDKLCNIVFCPIEKDKPFIIGDITVCAFSTMHDAVDPVGFTFVKDGKKIGYATDLGCYNQYIVDNLSNSNLLFLEANHDIRMLQVGPYPYYLKQRILGDHGHLSNELSGQLLCSVLNDKLKYIVLGHLSKENNYADLAYEAIQFEINEKSAYSAEKFDIFVAKSDSVLQPLAI